MFRQVISILLLALIPAAATALWHPRRPAWQSDEITPAGARALGAGVVWVDARPGAAYAQGHVPGAVSLDEDHWDTGLDALLDAMQKQPGQRKVVVYCSSLSCQASRDVARRLREEARLADVYVLEGGWEAWEKTR